MRRAWQGTVLAAVLPLLLASCAQDADAPKGQSQGAVNVHVDVDTPQLRALKKQAGVETCTQGDAAQTTGGMPDVTLPCLGGGPDVNLSTLRGPMVVNLFAQWCGPCRDELPFYQQLHERAGERIPVVGIDYLDTQPKAALELVKDTGVTYPLLADPSAQTRVPFRVRGLPGVVFIDMNGETHVEYVVMRSYAQLRQLVKQYLGVTV